MPPRSMPAPAADYQPIEQHAVRWGCSFYGDSPQAKALARELEGQFQQQRNNELLASWDLSALYACAWAVWQAVHCVLVAWMACVLGLQARRAYSHVGACMPSHHACHHVPGGTTFSRPAAYCTCAAVSTFTCIGAVLAWHESREVACSPLAEAMILGNLLQAACVYYSRRHPTRRTAAQLLSRTFYLLVSAVGVLSCDVREEFQGTSKWHQSGSSDMIMYTGAPHGAASAAKHAGAGQLLELGWAVMLELLPAAASGQPCKRCGCSW